MKATGFIRHVDDLGRIMLPKEVRRRMGISVGTPMEIFMSAEGVMLKKYYPENELLDMAENLMEAVEEMCVDLEPEKTDDIQRHIREIQMLLKSQN